ncbi:uncharacterized protein [Drosophila tropicalis]|uniref:uncharacterized protein n=1 Tax=Drosophila tropicalis TaxID=46794 RepID=UPI0035AB85D2
MVTRRTDSATIIQSLQDDITLAQLRTVAIYNLDAAVTPDELLAKLSSQAKVEMNALTVKSLRAGFRNYQTSILSAPEAVARKLIELGRVEIGWAKCRIRELEQWPLRCFKCLATGHIAAKCSSKEDRLDCCFKCGLKPKKPPCGQPSLPSYRRIEDPKVALMTQPAMKILQLNLNHCIAAQDLLQQTVRELRADIALLSEPYKIGTGPCWAKDSSGKAALWCCGSSNGVLQDILHENGFVRARFSSYWLYSCYLVPSLTLEQFGRTLEDDNERAGTGSIVDLSFASDSIAASATWSVGSTYSASDHEVITFTIGDSRHPLPRTQHFLEVFKPETLNPQLYGHNLDDLTFSENMCAEDSANSVMARLAEACEASMSQSGTYTRHHKPVFWWNDAIAEARRSCFRARRLYQRARRSTNFEALGLEYKRRRNILKTAIRSSKRECFLSLCDSAEHDPWDKAYQLVAKRLNSSRYPQPTDAQTVRLIVDGLFPEVDEAMRVPPLTPALHAAESTLAEVLETLLSGHGCFRSYLKRFNHDESDECTWCGAGIVEDASHVLQHCPRFDVERCRLQNVMGELVTSRNLIRMMIADTDVWEAVSAFAVRVMNILRKLERERSAQ